MDKSLIDLFTEMALEHGLEFAVRRFRRLFRSGAHLSPRNPDLPNADIKSLIITNFLLEARFSQFRDATSSAFLKYAQSVVHRFPDYQASKQVEIIYAQFRSVFSAARIGFSKHDIEIVSELTSSAPLKIGHSFASSGIHFILNSAQSQVLNVDYSYHSSESVRQAAIEDQYIDLIVCGFAGYMNNVQIIDQFEPIFPICILPEYEIRRPSRNIFSRSTWRRPQYVRYMTKNGLLMPPRYLEPYNYGRTAFDSLADSFSAIHKLEAGERVAANLPAAAYATSQSALKVIDPSQPDALSAECVFVRRSLRDRLTTNQWNALLRVLINGFETGRRDSLQAARDLLGQNDIFRVARDPRSTYEIVINNLERILINARTIVGWKLCGLPPTTTPFEKNFASTLRKLT